MPWTPRDAHKKSHKIKSAKAKKIWAAVANSVLSRTGDEGSAIRQANAVAGRKKRGRKGGTVLG